MIWHSTYKQSLGDTIAQTFNEHDANIFYMLWHSFGVSKQIKSAYFQLIRLGDEKHELTVQKCKVTDILTVKYFVHNYESQSFTK